MSATATNDLDLPSLWDGIQIEKSSDQQPNWETQQKLRIYTVAEWKIICRRNEKPNAGITPEGSTNRLE